MSSQCEAPARHGVVLPVDVASEVITATSGQYTHKRILLLAKHRNTRKVEPGVVVDLFALLNSSLEAVAQAQLETITLNAKTDSIDHLRFDEEILPMSFGSQLKMMTNS